MISLPKQIQRTSIRRRLVWLLAGATGLSLLFVLFAGAWQRYEAIKVESRQTLQALAMATGMASNAALAFGDRIAASDVLGTLRAYPHITAAALYDVRGRRIAEYGQNAHLPDSLLTGAAELPHVSFLDASAQTRAERRYQEFAHVSSQSLEDVQRDMARRDANDSSRQVAPLKPAPNAIHIDSSALTIDEVVDRILDYIKKMN